MKKPLIILFIIIILLLCSGSSYQDKSEGGKTCQTGHEQSPIDIKSKNVVKAKYNPLVLENYNKIYPALLHNNGRTVAIKIIEDDKPSITGGCLHSSYIFDHLHFHWSSEHTIDGKTFPLEMHIVHYDIKYKSLKDALTGGGVSVIGILFELSPQDDIILTPLIDFITQVEDRVEKPQEIKVKLSDFLPGDITKFYCYNGSLTTAECNEGVVWIIFPNTIPISKTQLEHFTSLKRENHQKIGDNHRPEQKLYKRTVYLHEMEH